MYIFQAYPEIPRNKRDKYHVCQFKRFQRETSFIPPAVHLPTTTSPKSAFSESITSRATPMIILSSTLTTNDKNHIQNSSKANLEHPPFYIYLVIDCSQQPGTVPHTDRAEKKSFIVNNALVPPVKSTQKITPLNALKKILSDSHLIFKRCIIVPSSL